MSCFTSNYILKWPLFLPETKLLYAPYFDGRCVVYPNDVILMDYLCWRQADCHINNLYNTAFHALVKSGTYSEREAEERLMVTTATAFVNFIMYFFCREHRLLIKTNFCSLHMELITITLTLC